MIVRLLALVLVLAGCSELPAIVDARCGNGIVEPFEDCDSPDSLCVQCRLVCADPDPGALTGNCNRVPGYTCGYDDRCYAPGAVFADSLGSVPFPVLGFRVVDIDGDSFGDVVGLNQALLTVRYGDARADLLDSYSVVTPPLQGPPALTHLESATVDDLVIPVIDGLVAFTGAFGVPSPRQFPLNSGGSAGNGRPDPIDAAQVDKTVALFGPYSKTDPTLTIGVLSLATGTPTFDAETRDLCGATSLASTFVIPKTFTYRSSNATFIAFEPVAGTLCVVMVQHQAQARGTGSCPSYPVTLPPCSYSITSIGTLPAFAADGVFADLDGDGCPSVLDASGGINSIVEYPGTTSGTTGCQIASAGTSLPPLGQPADAVLLHALPLVPPVSGLRADALITTYGIIGLSTAATPVPRSLYISDRPVGRTMNGDVNGDGAQDVVLTTSFPNIDLVRRVPNSDTFLLYRMPTTGPVNQFRIGDYDGDQRLDLAYAERLGEQDQLSIAYGYDGGLLPGVAVDAFTHVEYLAVIEVPDSTDPFSVVDDLIAIDKDPQTSSREITLLHGSPNRTMLSFYGSPVPEPGTAYRGVVAGNFIDTGDSAGLVDLLAFQTTDGGATRVHVIPGLPGGRLGAAQRTSAMTFPTTTDLDTCSPTHSAPFCLDLSKFVPWRTGGDHEIALGIDVRLDGGANGPSLVRIDPGPPVVVTTIPNAFPRGGQIRALEVLDVDRDGQPELVASFGPSTRAARDGYTLICEVTSDGTVASCTDVAAQILGDSALECVSVAIGRVTPACEDPDLERKDLVVVCRTPQYAEVVEVRGEGGKLMAGRELVFQAGKRFDDVQLGDVNGDSIDDLVVVDEASGIPQLEVYPQLTAPESNVCFPD